ncbi:MAG TPA: AIM24 family protein [Acidimicrobiales bacterium]|nr:AIM24 family protein [Acidimicrobiales bacterium]
MNAEVKGTTLPTLQVTLDPGEYVVSTHGDLAWMTANVQMSQTTATGGQKGLMAGLKRVVGGGGLFMTRYEAQGGQGQVTFAAKLPGRIFPVDIAPGNAFFVHRHGWLCGTSGVVPSVGLQQTFRGGIWGGDGFVLEKLEGTGTAWVELAGEITIYDLVPGQTMLAHPGHVGVFEQSVGFQITRVPGIANKLFGGDGYHLVALSGPGKVWLQSMPIVMLARALEPYLGGAAGADVAASGIGGGVLGDILGRNV